MTQSTINLIGVLGTTHLIKSDSEPSINFTHRAKSSAAYHTVSAFAFDFYSYQTDKCDFITFNSIKEELLIIFVCMLLINVLLL